MARLTFPDQQQDLQNAAGHSLAGECDWGVKVFDTRQMHRIWHPGFFFYLRFGGRRCSNRQSVP